MAAGDQSKLIRRIEEDLEFVQLLSNPSYVEFLIAQGFFEDEKFIHYLQSLSYLKHPALLQLVRYPICWKMLENLHNKQFVQFWTDNISPFTAYLNHQLFAHLVTLEAQRRSAGEIQPPLQRREE